MDHDFYPKDNRPTKVLFPVIQKVVCFNQNGEHFWRTNHLKTLEHEANTQAAMVVGKSSEYTRQPDMAPIYFG